MMMMMMMMNFLTQCISTPRDNLYLRPVTLSNVNCFTTTSDTYYKVQ